MNANVSPNGCAHCGKDSDKHAIEWHPGVKYHKWTEPSNELRKSRIRQRRAA